MTTPREHADPAVRYFMDNTLTCWARNKGSSDTEWHVLPNPRFNLSDLEYYVGHEPPPPVKRTITLTVNGREWVLPEPLMETPKDGVKAWILSIESLPTTWSWYNGEAHKAALAAGQLYATKDDCLAWAEFDKWCRGGGV